MRVLRQWAFETQIRGIRKQSQSPCVYVTIIAEIYRLWADVQDFLGIYVQSNLKAKIEFLKEISATHEEHVCTLLMVQTPACSDKDWFQVESRASLWHIEHYRVVPLTNHSRFITKTSWQVGQQCFTQYKWMYTHTYSETPVMWASASQPHCIIWPSCLVPKDIPTCWNGPVYSGHLSKLTNFSWSQGGRTTEVSLYICTSLGSGCYNTQVCNRAGIAKG